MINGGRVKNNGKLLSNKVLSDNLEETSHVCHTKEVLVARFSEASNSLELLQVPACHQNNHEHTLGRCGEENPRCVTIVAEETKTRKFSEVDSNLKLNRAIMINKDRYMLNLRNHAHNQNSDFEYQLYNKDQVISREDSKSVLDQKVFDSETGKLGC